MTGDTARWAVLVAAYLLGSVSFATVLVRFFHGADVRELGSGNAGATNVLRTAGKRLGLATLVLDALKGSFSVFLMGLVTHAPGWAAAAAFVAVIGHVLPVFFGFRGGKGVATAFGGFVVVSPLAALVSAGVFVVATATTRIVSLGSILAACALPATMGLLLHAGRQDVLCAAAASLLLVLRHAANIRRLLYGTERKLGEKDSAA